MMINVLNRAITAAQSLNILIAETFGGGKEPPMRNPPARREFPPPERRELDYEEGDFVAFPEKPHTGYRVDKIVGDRAYIFFYSQNFTTWVATHHVVLQRKARKQH
jgi:hypothetical protein